MPLGELIQLALAHLSEGVSLRGLVQICGIPATTLRNNLNPILAAFDHLGSGAPGRDRHRRLR
jgi:hypothetical protein